MASGQILIQDPDTIVKLELSKQKVEIKFDTPQTMYKTNELIKTFELEKDATYQVKLQNNSKLEEWQKLQQNQNVSQTLLDENQENQTSTLSKNQDQNIQNQTQNSPSQNQTLTQNQQNLNWDNQNNSQNTDFTTNSTTNFKPNPTNTLTLYTSQTPANTDEINQIYQIIKVNFRITQINNNLKQYQSQNPNTTTITNLTEEDKNLILDNAKKEKEIIKQQKQDEIDTQKAKLEKDKRLASFREEQKNKRKEIQKKVNQQKTNEISIDDAYLLGDTGLEFGIEIIPSDKPNKPFTLKIDENKIKNYKKDNTIADNIYDFFTNIINFGSIKTEAFNLEFGNVTVFHATPKTHMGTAFDLFNGSTTNGSTIGTWTVNNQ